MCKPHPRHLSKFHKHVKIDLGSVWTPGEYVCFQAIPTLDTSKHLYCTLRGWIKGTVCCIFHTIARVLYRKYSTDEELANWPLYGKVHNMLVCKRLNNTTSV